MYINRPESFIVPIKSAGFEERYDNLLRGEDDQYEVKVDVSKQEFDRVIAKTRRGINSFFDELYKTASKLTDGQIEQLNLALLREFFLITLKEVNFLEPLRPKYIKSDVKEWMDVSKKGYDYMYTKYGCNKYSSKEKVVSDEKFILYLLKRAEVLREFLDDIYDEASDFSIPQMVELIEDMGKQVFDLYVEYTPCLASLKDNKEVKDKYYKLIDSYVVSILNESKMQESIK